GGGVHEAVPPPGYSIAAVAGRARIRRLIVGPMAGGRIPPEPAERLEAIAGWMARHAEAIVGTAPGLEPWQFYGPTTRRGDRIYLHLLLRPYEQVTVRGLPIRRVTAGRAPRRGPAPGGEGPAAGLRPLLGA